MRVTKGKVISGNIIVEGESFAVAGVLVSDVHTFTLSDSEETARLESIAQANRGELLAAEVVLKRLQ
jgi:hypothetical protein